MFSDPSGQLDFWIGLENPCGLSCSNLHHHRSGSSSGSSSGSPSCLGMFRWSFGMELRLAKTSWSPPLDHVGLGSSASSAGGGAGLGLCSVMRVSDGGVVRAAECQERKPFVCHIDC